LPLLVARDEEETTPLDDDELLALARAGGEYPDGSLGEGALRRELAQIRDFARNVNGTRTHPCLPAHTVRLDFPLGDETWTLQAAFGALRPDGLVYTRYDDTRARDYLSAWLDHLTLCASPPDGVACRTHALSRDGDFELSPVPPDEARRLLGVLLSAYRDGLREPLHFFPKSAWEYAKRDNEAYGMKQAQKKWADGDYAERNDPAYRLALRGVADALDDEFRENATALFGAMRDYLMDSRL